MGSAPLKKVTAPVSAPGPTEVLVKVHAISANYRDLAIIKGGFPLG